MAFPSEVESIYVKWISGEPDTQQLENIKTKPKCALWSDLLKNLQSFQGLFDALGAA